MIFIFLKIYTPELVRAFAEVIAEATEARLPTGSAPDPGDF